MPQRYLNNAGYTALSTAGTTTLNQGQAAGPPISDGVLYGAMVSNAGTSFAVAFVDILPANQGGGTNTLMPTQTGSAGQVLSAGPGGLGVRYKGALVAITSGTPGVINALWD